MEDDTDDGGAPATQAAAGSTKRMVPDRIGARLGAARIAANIELVDIARETRVPLRHLRAIEADAHDELPAMPYAVGFVKSFARIVGLDPDEAAARFRAETTMVPHTPMPASIEPLDERRLPSRGLVVTTAAALVVILGGLTAYGAGWFDRAVPAASTQAQAGGEAPPAEAQAGVNTTAGADAPAAAVAVAPDAATALSPPPSSGVSILAVEDAWIRISRTDPATGKAEAVKTGLLAKGQRYDLPAGQAGLKLWTGRAGALQLSVDGRTIPPLGGPVETVRNVNLDADALRARATPAAAASTPAPGAAAAQ